VRAARARASVCVRACVSVYVLVCVRARVSVCGCARACVCARGCVCVSVRVRARVCVFFFFSCVGAIREHQCGLGSETRLYNLYVGLAFVILLSLQ